MWSFLGSLFFCAALVPKTASIRITSHVKNYGTLQTAVKEIDESSLDSSMSVEVAPSEVRAALGAAARMSLACVEQRSLCVWDKFPVVTLVNRSVTSRLAMALDTDPTIWMPNIDELVAQPWTSSEMLKHILNSCRTSMEKKHLGLSESSSKSGAIFWNCATPDSNATYGRILVKEGIRGEEWSAVKDLMIPSGKRYGEDTLLNKMLFGFSAYGKNFLVVEDLKAKRLVGKLVAMGIVPKEQPRWIAYDIKPRGSRAPQRDDCFKHLSSIAIPPGLWTGWTRMEEALKKDLNMLASLSIMDESLFVQVLMEVPLDAVSRDKISKLSSEIDDVFRRTPTCAYSISTLRQTLSMVCVSVLDYTLSFNLMKSVQNVMQFGRWNEYDKKVAQLMKCVGSLPSGECGWYRGQATKRWREIYEQEWRKNGSAVAAMRKVKNTHTCCCSLVGVGGVVALEGQCDWHPLQASDVGTRDKRKDPCLWGWRKVSLKLGGCWGGQHMLGRSLMNEYAIPSMAPF